MRVPGKNYNIKCALGSEYSKETTTGLSVLTYGNTMRPVALHSQVLIGNFLTSIHMSDKGAVVQNTL